MLIDTLKVFSICLLLVVLGGCYRMPTEDDYCLIPTTNNPSITRQSDAGIPGVSY